jgi:hypothetical protein
MYKWIDVNKQFPDSGTRVLVCLNGKLIMTSYFFEDLFGKWFSSTDEIWDKYYTDSVTHWAILPEMPTN